MLFFYTDTEPDFWKKIKQKLIIRSALNLPDQLMNSFEFNETGCR